MRKTKKTLVAFLLLFTILLTGCAGGNGSIEGGLPQDSDHENGTETEKTPDVEDGTDTEKTPDTQDGTDTEKAPDAEGDTESEKTPDADAGENETQDPDNDNVTEVTGRNMNVCVNIAADGVESRVIKSPKYDKVVYERAVESYVASYLKGTNVGRMVYNVSYRRSVVDSDTVDSMLYNVARDEDGFLIRDEYGKTQKTLAPESSASMLKLYKTMIERGIDVFAMMVKETHKYEAEAYFSIRMNDHHYTDDPGFNTSFSYDTPEVSGIDGLSRSMDFTKPAVQAYYREYVRELCEKYDIDGIELDFLRSCPIMSDASAENRDALTDYIAELRAVIDEVAEKKGKTIGLSVRVYSEEKQNLDYGIDVAQWVADGSVDQVTVSGWYIPTYYNIPLEEWRESIDARNTAGNPYTLLAGTDWGVRCDSRPYVGYLMWITLEQFKGFVSAAYDKGADGIYLFNHFLPTDDHGGATYYVDEEGNKTRELVMAEKLIAANSQEEAEAGVRVYVNTCRDSENTLYPIKIGNSSYKLAVNTGTAAENEYIVRVGIDAFDGYQSDLLAVWVNGEKAQQIEDVACEEGFIWEAGTATEPVAEHVSETCARVLQFSLEDLGMLEDGENTVEISNKNPAFPQSIKWLEVYVN